MILVIFMLSILSSAPTHEKIQDSKFKIQDLNSGEATTDVPVRGNALKVLNEKCNVCHRRQNPRKVFTEGNMDELAPAIYKQVFVKKRMPRGNTIKLTEDDEKALMDWLRTQGITKQL